ncbi:MAG: formylglycine-generating enzyme family protein, partial [Anaerolineae bacterium]|nr:formylglycine-generating enzyme family protein [Anaerolineae bacterium]
PKHGEGAIPDIDWVEIPAGTFLMGDGKEQHEVYLPTYFIGRYPVTYRQFQAFLDADDGFESDQWWVGIEEKYRKQSMVAQQFGFDNYPRGSVNWYQAAAFCLWLTTRLAVSIEHLPFSGQQLDGADMIHHPPTFEIRLPTEAEWEKAARGTNGLIYPYGNEYDPTKMNTADLRIKQPTAVGMFLNGASPYGVMDMGGNLWEWCNDAYQLYPDNINIGRGNLSETNRRSVRGGSFISSHSRARTAFRYVLDPPIHYKTIGFRVVCASISRR